MRSINRREKPKKLAVLKRQVVYDADGKLMAIEKEIKNNEVVTEYKYI